ncbi:MAG TPA: ATP-binding protein [Desulfoprunum sp.]|nr:ATP-binding protein [Desulfoprunum sp.]
MGGQSQAEKALAEMTRDLGSNIYLYQILEETPNGVMVVNLQHQIIYANPAACHFLSIPCDQIVDASIAEVLDVENAGLFRLIADFLNSPAGRKMSRFRHEIEIKGADEQTTDIDVVLVYPPSRPDYYLLYLIDITARKKLEAELRRRNTFFHNLIDSSVDGIIAADMKGRLILFNQGAQALLGYSEEEAIAGLHVTGLYNEGVAYELIKRMRSDDYGGKGKLLHHELMVKNRDEQMIPVRFSGGILYDRGHEIATFGIFTDLRAMQKIEEDLEQTHNMLMQSEKMAGLGRLAAGVAHEINNPMSGIMLYANLVKEALGDGHSSGEDLDVIIHEAERCKVIVADLLEFSHQTTYDMALVDLNDIVRKTIGVLKNQPLFQNIEMQLDLEEELLPIFGNSIRLNQVVMNIVVNAAQAMEGQGIIRIVSRTRASRDIVEIVISDTGPGIEEDRLEKIFDPFYTTKEPGEGTGLGLSVSYAIVKEHKGIIRVTSQPEGGAVFSLRFPAVMENLTGENHEQ